MLIPFARHEANNTLVDGGGDHVRVYADHHFRFRPMHSSTNLPSHMLDDTPSPISASSLGSPPDGHPPAAGSMAPGYVNPKGQHANDQRQLRLGGCKCERRCAQTCLASHHCLLCSQPEPRTLRPSGRHNSPAQVELTMKRTSAVTDSCSTPTYRGRNGVGNAQAQEGA